MKSTPELYIEMRDDINRIMRDKIREAYSQISEKHGVTPSAINVRIAEYLPLEPKPYREYCVHDVDCELNL